MSSKNSMLRVHVDSHKSTKKNGNKNTLKNKAETMIHKEETHNRFGNTGLQHQHNRKSQINKIK